MTTQTTFAPGCLYKVTNKDYQLLFLIDEQPRRRTLDGGHSALVMALDSLLHDFHVSIWSFHNYFLKCLWNEQVAYLLVDVSVEFAPVDETD